jgi:hypothetical protein
MISSKQRSGFHNDVRAYSFRKLTPLGYGAPTYYGSASTVNQYTNSLFNIQRVSPTFKKMQLRRV